MGASLAGPSPRAVRILPACTPGAPLLPMASSDRSSIRPHPPTRRALQHRHAVEDHTILVTTGAIPYSLYVRDWKEGCTMRHVALDGCAISLDVGLVKGEAYAAYGTHTRAINVMHTVSGETDKLVAHSDAVSAAAFAPAGERLVTAAHGGIATWVANSFSV